MKKYTSKLNKPKITVSFVLLWIFILISLVPLYVMIIGSLKPNLSLYIVPPDLNPFKLITDNYKYVFTEMEISRYFGNSIFISGMISLITVFVSASAGYAFAKRDFAGKRIWFALMLATMMLPRQILLVPNFLVAKGLVLTDKLIGVVLTSINSAFGIFLCRQFMATLPNELSEAAEIDGCSDFGIFFKIILPLSKPVLGALAIFSFIGGWNDFMWQNIMLTSGLKRTMPLAIAFLAQAKVTYIGYQMAGAALCAIPMVVIFLCFQKYFIKGITVGSVKG